MLNGVPVTVRSNVYVCPLYSISVGFCTSSSEENTYAKLSTLSDSVTLIVLCTARLCPATVTVCGP